MIKFFASVTRKNVVADFRGPTCGKRAAFSDPFSVFPYIGHAAADSVDANKLQKF